MTDDFPVNIYFETGKKKSFACALAWPGWCRSGNDEASAIQTLIRYAPRYAKAIKTTNLVFLIPGKTTDFNIIDHIAGNYATDFGVPDLPIPGDSIPLSESEIQRQIKILQALWLSFDQARQSAQGKELRKGPRGGGREMIEITNHVVNAEKGYLRHLGWSGKILDGEMTDQHINDIRREIVDGILAATRGQFPPVGPRGGKRWPLPYFIRRVAWHVLDHTWEIEDRTL